jgi:hypothetical protein
LLDTKVEEISSGTKMPLLEPYPSDTPLEISPHKVVDPGLYLVLGDIHKRSSEYQNSWVKRSVYILRAMPQLASPPSDLDIVLEPVESMLVASLILTVASPCEEYAAAHM